MKNISSGIADMLWTQGIIQEDDIDKCNWYFVFVNYSVNKGTDYSYQQKCK